MQTPNPTTLQITPTGTRGSSRASKAPVDETVTTLNPTPPNVDPDAPSAFNAQDAVKGDVVGSALRPPTDEQAKAQEEAAKATQYFRYTGTDRRIRMVEKSPIPGVPSNGYTTTIHTGKVFNSKDYDLKALANQGLIVGRNLEEISEADVQV